MIGRTPKSERTTARLLAALTALVLIVAAVLPALHRHDERGATDETACQAESSSWPASTAHVERLAVEHHEPCGVCAKRLSSHRAERSLPAVADVAIARQPRPGLEILPQAPPGRHGASRAPPRA